MFGSRVGIVRAVQTAAVVDFGARDASFPHPNKPMTSIGWLHLADLHQTLRRPAWPSPMIRQEVYRDLELLHESAGPWDLVIVAGDLSMQGAPEEFEQAEETLNDLLHHLRSIGSKAYLLAVPGNHDLARTKGASSAHGTLRRYHDDPHVRDEFWNDPESPSRRLVDRALEPFDRWWRGREVSPHVSVSPGLLPGDFTATLRKDGVRFGIAGLCSAFLQVTDDDYAGSLGIAPHQLTVASGGDVPAWIAQHDAAILVTHHAPSWLAQEDRRRYEAEINPAGRFCAHLSAHLHEAAPLIDPGDRVQIRCPSFFGLDAWGSPHGHSGARRFGYTAARLSFDGDETRLAVYPRIAGKNGIRPAFALADLDPTGCVTLGGSRVPRLADSAPEFLVERAALRDTLAAIYPAALDASRLARTVGLRVGEGGGAAVDLWHVVVSEAERQGGLDLLVNLARSEHQENPELDYAWAAYERATSPESAAPAPWRGSAEAKLADELYETLAEVEPPVFDAVLRSLSIHEDAKESSAPQGERAIAAVKQVEREGFSGLQRLDAAILHVSGTTAPPEQSETTKSSGYGWLAALGVAGLLLGALASEKAAPPVKRARRARAPTRPSLSTLLTRMFTDERDFDGFVLDHFPSAYQLFNRGMTRATRISLLLDAVTPADVVARARRAHPKAFKEHQLVLDYEDVGAAPDRARKR